MTQFILAHIIEFLNYIQILGRHPCRFQRQTWMSILKWTFGSRILPRNDWSIGGRGSLYF
jgi:hypothetical protein